MIYLDYSATTPVNDEVLESFNICSKKFIGNPNSLHKLGMASKQIIEDATNQIADILKVKPTEIIYTSGSSESNNLAIKGICLKYKNRGNHIITTNFEHSSIYGPINYLIDNGFEVDFVDTDDNGLVDINHLKSLVRENTILVTINAVNSEIGLLQPIEEIGKILKDANCFFHVDLTQAVGKVKIDIENVDLVSFTAHKFYGLKGIGCLIKKDKINLLPLIHGGKSTTVYRSGTPAPALIVSLAKALRLAITNLDLNNQKVMALNSYLKDKLKYEGVYINSNNYSIPHIINISVLGVKPETMLHALAEDDIYISTQSACATGNISKAVLALTKDQKKAESSIRVSISHLTTKEEIDEFLQSFEKNCNSLRLK